MATQGAKVTAAQMAEHSKASDCWMSINGNVYNVTDFLEEHPGGDEVLLAEAGKDATEAFDDVGHSEDARQLLKPMLVGALEGKVGELPQEKPTAAPKSDSSSAPILMSIPIALLLAYYVYQYYLEQRTT